MLNLILFLMKENTKRAVKIALYYLSVDMDSVGDPVPFFDRFRAFGSGSLKKGPAPGSCDPFYKFILPAPVPSKKA